MSTSDPVLFPAPNATSETMRQDVARTRGELAATVEALASRLDVKRAAGRGARAAATGLAPVAGASAIGALAFAVARRARGSNLVSGAGSAAAGALAYIAIDRVVRSRPALSSAPARRIGTATVVATLGPSPDGGDVVDVLIAQHRRADRQFAHVAAAPAGTARREAFAALVSILRRHEKAEQEIVHPTLRALGGHSAAVVAGRLDEEHTADRAIGAMISRDTDNEYFGMYLAELRQLVQAHAQHEESEEFPLIRALVPLEERQRMANNVQAATRGEEW